MTTYRYTPAQRDMIGSGRVVLQGDTVKLTASEERDPTNARLISLGALAPESTTPPRRPRRPKTTPNKEQS